jgi:hypothetical protein
MRKAANLEPVLHVLAEQDRSTALGGGLPNDRVPILELMALREAGKGDTPHHRDSPCLSSGMILPRR